MGRYLGQKRRNALSIKIDMRFIAALLVGILFMGCCSKRPLATTVSTLDSTHVEKTVRLRDTIVNLPFYKVGIISAAKDLTGDPISKRNGNATVNLYKKNDSIYASAACDSLELQLQLKDSIISSFREVKTATTVTLPPEQVKFTPWYMKALAWIGGISLLYILIKVAYTLYKPKFI